MIVGFRSARFDDAGLYADSTHALQFALRQATGTDSRFCSYVDLGGGILFFISKDEMLKSV